MKRRFIHLLSPSDDSVTLRRRLRVFTALSFVIALLVGASFSALYMHLHTMQEQASVDAVAASHTSLLEERLSHSLSATYALAAALRQGRGEIENFDVLGTEVLRVYGGLASVQLAPDGVVAAVVPFVGNAEVIGHDLLNDPARRQEARMAVETRQLTLAGPLLSRQGEQVLIGRLPVFLADSEGQESFWGFCIALIRASDLLADSGLHELPGRGFHYQLASIDRATGERKVFAHAGPARLEAPLQREFEVRNHTWALSIAPRDGWLEPNLWVAALIAPLLLATLVAAFTWSTFRHPLLLHWKVEQRTRELAEANRRLLAEGEERERAQREVVYTNRLYTVLSHTNSAIVRIGERSRLLDEVCRIAVDLGNFAVARIALIEPETRRWVWYAQRGAFADLPDCDERIEEALQTGARGSALAVRGCKDGGGAEAAPLCEQAAAAGFRSHVVMRLQIRGRTVGLFALYAREADAFDPSQLALLEEMAGDVAFALENIEREESRRRTETKLRKLSRAVEQSASAILITDRDGIIEYVNPWFTRITGYKPDEVLGRTPSLLRSDETHPETYKRMWEVLLSGKEWTGELHNRKKNGELYWCLETISPLKDEDGNVTHFVAVTEDISERKENEQTIRHLAFHDPLTSLPNRRLFNDRLHQAAVSRQRKDQGFALVLIDIDRFKTVNDSFGHDAGDALLKLIGTRLESVVRGSDTLARIGGDEFGLIVGDVTMPEEAARIVENLLTALKSQAFLLYGQELFVSASIGVTLFPHDGSEPGLLIRNADAALFRAKEQGRNNFQFFTADMNAAMLERLRLENAMRSAVERNEFLLHYQPQVDIATGVIHGAEALVRWKHPELGMVSPAQFIPLAEETGMIVDIGEWILRTACVQAKSWQLAGKPLRVAVNLSARQFRQGDLAQIVQATLAEFDLPPQLLEVELTEGILMDDTEQTSQTLEQLHAMGVQISIDDFGTGYSSLSYLKRLPIQILKIDQSFVRDIHHDPDDRAIVTAVIALAHSMKLKVIAEGVENREQLAFLREHGCDMMQGYLFSRPIPGPELLALQMAETRLGS